MEQKESERVVEMESLPEGCVSNIISFTSPVEACRLCLVSPTFKSASDSNSVWDRFLPPDVVDFIISKSSPTLVDSPHHLLASFTSKKLLFFSLSHHPILIEDAKKSFWLDKWSGKKCYMLAARDLMIAWGSTPQYWTWITMLDSRFPEVAQLELVWWLEIRGKIETSMLSPTTRYAAFLVFKWGINVRGFHHYPTEVSIGTTGSGINKSRVCLAPDNHLSRLRYVNHNVRMNALQHPNRRRDGWFEIELGEYYNECGEDGELEMSVMEVKASKRGIIIQGIEIRPKC